MTMYDMPEKPCTIRATANFTSDHPPYFEDEECGSLDGMNQELDFSTLSINFQAGADAAVELLPVPPDGGYGWVIVLAAFFSNLIVDGVCTCFTEFKSSYSQHFHSSDAATALIGSLLIGVYLLVGPVVGGLVNKYGARKVVIGGAFISGTAFLISVASPNIYFFMLIYGVLGGVGFGMIYLPAIVVVGYYFESKRAIATGIAVAGSGVGTMVMPFLTEFCISSKNRANSQMSNENDSPTKRISRVDGENIHDDPVMARLRSALSECENDADTSPSTPVRPPLSPVFENAISKSRAGSTHQTHIAPNVRARKLTLTSMTSDMASNNDLKASRATLSGPQLSRISARSFAQSLSRLSNKGEASCLSIAMSGVDPQEFARPMNRQDIFYAGSIKNLKEFKQEGNNIQSYRGSVMSIPRSVIGQAASSLSQAGDLHELGSRIGGSRLSRITGGLGVEDDDILDDFYDSGRCKWIPLAIRNAFSEMIDLELLKDSVMMLLCVSNLLGMMGFYIPFVFLKDLAHTHGTDPSDSRYLVPVIGVTNTAGLVYDVTQSYSAAFFFAGFVIVVSGLISCAIPFVHKWKRSHGDNEGDDTKDMDNASGKLSVLTERSEENLTEYQRTIQSLRQQHALLQEIEEEKRKLKSVDKRNGTVEEVNEEDGDDDVQRPNADKSDN
ncbi:hypothetical protein ANCCEY_00076 [Ancylostoma ceylanicum]|uniref:Major facilitator superfamily (MFS) profile domain-containing protein n=1 Tax=Ancylostoma ceylanicum TaxID=53326 RepID=A0A0D6M9Q2_9BILA|nr:hypothetical protein ANCCEY_00076 [Ancylostoma ceylanicum]